MNICLLSTNWKDENKEIEAENVPIFFRRYGMNGIGTSEIQMDHQTTQWIMPLLAWTNRPECIFIIIN